MAPAPEIDHCQVMPACGGTDASTPTLPTRTCSWAKIGAAGGGSTVACADPTAEPPRLVTFTCTPSVPTLPAVKVMAGVPWPPVMVPLVTVQRYPIPFAVPWSWVEAWYPALPAVAWANAVIAGVAGGSMGTATTEVTKLQLVLPVAFAPVTTYVPSALSALGVPEITPVLGSRSRPGGSAGLIE